MEASEAQIQMKRFNKDTEMYDVAIIGAGAAGIAAAIEIKLNAPSFRLIIIEKNDDVAKKVKATGNGKCNIANSADENYKEILKFFNDVGISVHEKSDNRLYPCSESAADVVKLLKKRLNKLGIQVLCSSEAVSVESTSEDSAKKHYSIRYKKTGNEQSKGDQEKKIIAKRLILATGGKSAPFYGTTGDGHKIARNLGHRIITPIPVLTGIECSQIIGSGIRQPAKIFLYKKGKLIFEEAGEVQFTKYGISGICVFNMTRYMRFDKDKSESINDFDIFIDVSNSLNVRELINKRLNTFFSDDSVKDLLLTFLKAEIAEYVLSSATKTLHNKGIEFCENMPISEISASQCDDIYGCSQNDNNTEIILNILEENIKKLPLKPTGIRGWKDAQLTAGGVDIDEVDKDTCESKISSGLYIVGELLDRDYPCGGFNLGNAWVTGTRAAKDITNKSI